MILRLFAFVCVWSRLRAFVCILRPNSESLKSAFVCVCARLFAFVCVCQRPLLLHPPFAAPDWRWLKVSRLVGGSPAHGMPMILERLYRAENTTKPGPLPLFRAGAPSRPGACLPVFCFGGMCLQSSVPASLPQWWSTVRIFCNQASAISSSEILLFPCVCAVFCKVDLHPRISVRDYTRTIFS